MNCIRMDRKGESFAMASFIEEGMQMCPFLRNIRETTSFAFLSSNSQTFPTLGKGTRGPIFEDGPNFETAFRIFHGHDGVVPLLGRATGMSKVPENSKNESETGSVKFHPLAASAASISLNLSSSGPFSFDNFMRKKMKKNASEKKYTEQGTDPGHEALSNEWLETGNCPIAKSYRAVSGVLPLVAQYLKPPPGMNLQCPPAIVAARAALAKTVAVKALRPQPLPTKVLAVGLLGMALNAPLGVWREHTSKFSPSWFVAVHASVPFVAMLRKAVRMPKHVMAFTIAASILGQALGARAERRRIESEGQAQGVCVKLASDSHYIILADNLSDAVSIKMVSSPSNALQCGKETWPKGDVICSTTPIGAF